MKYLYLPQDQWEAGRPQAGPLALDLETYLITPTDKAPTPVVASLAYATGDGAAVTLVPAWDGLTDMLARIRASGVWLVGANLAFDLGVIERWLGNEFTNTFRHRHFDVQIHERLLQIQSGDPAFKHAPVSLAGLAERYLGVKLDKENPWRLKYSELAGLPIKQWPLEAVTYAVEDAAATLLVHKAQYPPGGIKLSADEIEFQQLAALELHAMSVRGIEIDQGLVEELDADWSARVADFKAALGVVGLAGPKGSLLMGAIQSRVESALGSGAPRTPSGRIRTDADTLRATGDPALLQVVALKKIQKLTTTYLPFMRQPSVHCGRWGLADTGRTTSSDPNLQNLPKRGLGAAIRPAFIARPGMVFVEADYPSCELRCLAHICHMKFGKSSLQLMLNGSQDPATWLAASMASVDPVQLQLAVDRGDPQAKEMRQRAKMAVYGLPGGMGVDRFIQTARVQSEGKIIFTRSEFYALKDAWLQMFPEMNAYFQWIRSHEEPGGFYRMRAWGTERWRGGMRYTEAANSQFQGLAADIGKDALIRVGRHARASQGPDAFLVGYVHDSILLEVREESAPFWVRRLEECMAESGLERAGSVGWPVKAKVSVSWS